MAEKLVDDQIKKGLKKFSEEVKTDFILILFDEEKKLYEKKVHSIYLDEFSFFHEFFSKTPMENKIEIKEKGISRISMEIILKCIYIQAVGSFKDEIIPIILDKVSSEDLVSTIFTANYFNFKLLHDSAFQIIRNNLKEANIVQIMAKAYELNVKIL